MNETRPKLTLIPGRRRGSMDDNAFQPFEPGPQSVLFPETRPGIVIFVCFPDVEEREFVSLLQNGRPSFVIDLRIVPRFDVGRLNRDRAFDLFESMNTRYIDLTGILMCGASRSASTNDVMRSFHERSLPAASTFTVR